MVEFDVFIVDWIDFERQLQEKDAYAVLVGDEDDEDELVGGQDAEEMPHTDNSYKRPGDFIEAYHRFLDVWDSPHKAAFEGVFYALFACFVYQPRRIELNAPEHNLFGIDTALSPTTIQQLAALSGQLDLQECETPFRESAEKTGDYSPFSSFDWWRDYGQAWLDIVRRAAAQNKGIVLFVYA